MSKEEPQEAGKKEAEREADPAALLRLRFCPLLPGHT